MQFSTCQHKSVCISYLVSYPFILYEICRFGTTFFVCWRANIQKQIDTKTIIRNTKNWLALSNAMFSYGQYQYSHLSINFLSCYSLFVIVLFELTSKIRQNYCRRMLTGSFDIDSVKVKSLTHHWWLKRSICVEIRI